VAMSRRKGCYVRAWHSPKARVRILYGFGIRTVLIIAEPLRT
jgi:hypothetical protein